MNKAQRLRKDFQESRASNHKFQTHIVTTEKAFDDLIKAHWNHDDERQEAINARGVVLKIMRSNTTKAIRQTQREEFICYMSLFSNSEKGLSMEGIKEDYPDSVAKSLVKQLVGSGDLVKTSSNSGATMFYQLSQDWLSPDNRDRQ